MKYAFISLMLLGALDPTDLDADAADSMSGCDCNRKREKAKADVPENTPLAPPAVTLIDTAQVAPLSNVPSLYYADGLGTDLGVSFVRDGQLVFLFGDTNPKDPDDDCCVDSVAVTPDGAFAQRQPLEFLRKPGGGFLPLAPPGVKLKGMEVPVEGVAAGPDTYVFFSTGWHDDWGRHESLALAKTQGTDFGRLQTLWIQPSDRFINVSIVEDGNDYWIFGSGSYRLSAVYLARVPKAQLADHSAWRYWRRDPGGAISWVADERAASQVVPNNCVGELSVRYEPKLALYLMAYNCGTPRGVTLHTSPAPDGPWSEGVHIFDPGLHGYGKFMHVPVSFAGKDDHLSDPRREEEWGGEYGPYFVPSWTTVEWNGDVSIYYALSSWNPYHAHIIRSTLRRR
ncbi:MAG: DUF4185 domain-containing protein [Deltaproteobacteria bacterium]|nr:DUF4185 domain-containing protein [Deltaproteobacteria bacterium]